MPYNPFLPIIESVLPEPHASLLSGILFGVRTQLPSTLYQSLIQTGTIHIIALSGMNVTILMSLLGKITFWMGKRASTLLIISFIIFFVWFTGSSPSIIRAAIMGCLLLIAPVFGRQYWPLLGLFLTGLIMLLFNSSLISDLSFQLSFLSTFGILLANNNHERQKPNGLSGQFIYALKENLRLTLSAQLFTVPVILITFGRFSLVAPLANILIEWAIQPIMILGLVLCITGLIFNHLAQVIGYVVWIPLHYVVLVVDMLSKLPFAFWGS